MGRGVKIPWIPWIRGIKIPWVSGSIHHGQGVKNHGYVGQNTMGKWVKTPWVGYGNTMDREVDIHVPWVGGS
jgi:hypothetical protein